MHILWRINFFVRNIEKNGCNTQSTNHPSFIIQAMSDSTSTKRKQYSAQSLQSAIDVMNDDNDHRSVRRIAAMYHVPESTLRRFKKQQVTTIDQITKSGPGSYLNAEQEELLVQWIQTMQLLHTPVGKSEVTKMVAGLMSDESLTHLSWSWWKGFKERNPSFGWKNTESLDKQRVDSSSANSVKHFFNLLSKQVDERKYTIMWNMDETGVNGEKSATRRVFIDKSIPLKYDRATLTKEHVTFVVAVSHLGTSIPPLAIFKGKRFMENLTAGGPPGIKTVLCCCVVL